MATPKKDIDLSAVCALCGKSFIKKKQSHKIQKFCSRTCWYESRLFRNLTPEQRAEKRKKLTFFRRKSVLSIAHRLSEADYDSMVAGQSGLCAICKKLPPKTKAYSSERLIIDHDHACCPLNKSCPECRRGLLCQGCNRGLGFFKDNEDALISAAQYLRNFREKKNG